MSTTTLATTPRTSSANAPRTSRRSLSPYWLIAPAVLLIAGFIAYPAGTVLYFSLFDYNASKPWATEFVGLENFRVMLFEDPEFWRTLEITVRWVVTEVGLQLVLGLSLAVLLNRTFRHRGLVRALMFAPWAVSGVLATQIWLLIYNPSTGLADVLTRLGTQSQFAPLSSASGAFWSVVIAEVWRGIPFFAILILADMQSIPGELYEAAKVDGANPWQQFVFITLPYLRDAIIITTLLRAVWEFNNVDLIYTLTGGGPAGATTTLPLYVVNEAVGSRNFGYGSALTVAGFVILLAFSAVYLRLGHSSQRKGAS